MLDNKILQEQKTQSTLHWRKPGCIGDKARNG